MHGCAAEGGTLASPMSDWAPNVAGRLEEIDRRLREIQAELVPGRVPRETQVPVNPSDADSSSPPGAAPDAEATAGVPPAPDAAAGLDSDEPVDRPRGRSGPLAEALQRARNARIAGLTASRAPLPERAVPDSTASEPLPIQPPAAEPQASEPPPQAADPPHAAEPPPRSPSRPRSRHPRSRPRRATDEPPPQARPAPPAPSPVHHALRQARLRSDPRVDVLAELQSSLLTATRDLLDGYERASFTASEQRANRVTISAGPFAGTDSLRAFEQELSALPGVHGVDVRGYEGSDRAIIEVELEGPENRKSPSGNPPRTSGGGFPDEL